MLKNLKEDVIYASVLADGRIHITVNENTEGAVKREYETSDGKTGSKWELVYSEISGMLSKINFFEGDYGKSLQLTITDGDEKPVVLSLSCASNYGEDAMKKLMNVDMEKEVKIVPYSFTDDKGKSKKGVTIYQDDEKIQNYFYDAKKEKNVHGYPEPKKLKKPLNKDQWKMYFMEVRMFLIDTITEHFKLEEAETAQDRVDKVAKEFDSNKD